MLDGVCWKVGVAVAKMLGGHWDGVVQGGVVRIHDDQLHCERSQKRTAYLSCHFNFNIKSMVGGISGGIS